MYAMLEGYRESAWTKGMMKPSKGNIDMMTKGSKKRKRPNRPEVEPLTT